MKIIEKFFDIATGEENIIERDASAEEIAKAEAEQTAALKFQEEAKAKAEAKAAAEAKLAALGLTADDLKALGL